MNFDNLSADVLENILLNLGPQDTYNLMRSSKTNYALELLNIDHIFWIRKIKRHFSSEIISCVFGDAFPKDGSILRQRYYQLGNAQILNCQLRFIDLNLSSFKILNDGSYNSEERLDEDIISSIIDILKDEIENINNKNEYSSDSDICIFDPTIVNDSYIYRMNIIVYPKGVHKYNDTQFKDMLNTSIINSIKSGRDDCIIWDAYQYSWDGLNRHIIGTSVHVE